MKVESVLFLGVTAFLAVVAVVYGLWAREPIGTTALVLSAGLTGLCGSYFAFIARRIEPRPEDRADAEIAEGAGELGFFSPSSYWPIGIALAASVVGLGVAYWQAWLLALGVIAMLIMVAGLLFEYYIGQGQP
jgi:hypothetical protein